MLKNLTGLSTEDNIRWTKHFHDAESESGQYAKLCYTNDAGPEGCSFFYNRSIHYTVRHNEPCPFADDMCHDGSAGAFSADTGLIDVEAIGINTPLRYNFRRLSTCSPLRMDIGRFLRPDNETQSWRYFFGRNGNPIYQCPDEMVDCTWSIPFDAADPNKPTYQAYTLSFSDFADQIGRWQRWRPIPSLRSLDGSTVTLIGIQNSFVTYNERRDDPIFPATEQYSDGSWFDPKFNAGIIGCNDQVYICEPHNGTCYSAFEAPVLTPADNKTQTVIQMLSFSQIRFSLYDAIVFRLQNALDAQSKLIQRRSLPLAEEQWKVEVEQLFKTSLARMQIDARNLARGSGDVLPRSINFVKTLPISAQICNSYKFRSVGWKNINIKAFQMCIAFGSILIVLGVEKGDKLWVEGAFTWMGGLDLSGLGTLIFLLSGQFFSTLWTLVGQLSSVLWWFFGEPIMERMKKDVKSLWDLAKKEAKRRCPQTWEDLLKCFGAQEPELGARNIQRIRTQDGANWWTNWWKNAYEMRTMRRN